MPELPEVETIARGVDERLRGDRIEAVWFSGRPEPFKTPPRAMAQALPGHCIGHVGRVGKHIVFDLSGERTGRAQSPATNSGIQWIVHLGMTGRLLIAAPGEPAPPHTHAILSLASGRELRFVDPRRFGRLSLHEAGEGGASGAPGRFTGSGREPLAVSAEEFAALFHGRRTPVKSALLNQKLLQGVGNIYADESLFRAGVRPRRLAGRLTRDELDRLRTSLRQVLREAIARGGSSVADYVNATGEKGLFQMEHRVYMRTGQPCLVCGRPIRRIVVAGRGTHYCSHCQK